MELIKKIGLPLICQMSIYESNNGHLIGITLLFIFSIDISIEREHINLTIGVSKLYAQVGIGIC